MRYKKILILFLGISLCLIALSFSASAEETGDPNKGGLLDFDGIISEWLEQEIDTPTGTTFKLWEHYGGFWADAEKDPDPGDNLLCWAATAANMMEWTGWGFVGGMENDDTDDFLQFFRSHMTDGGHFIDAGIDWWFDGTLRDEGSDAAKETADHTGFWSGETASDYIFESWSKPDTLPNILDQLTDGKAVGISIYSDGGGAHAVTCWGVNYNPGVDPTTDPEDYYLGVWLTDSDSHKNQWNPPDVVRYFAVEYNSTNSRWEMPHYGGGWYIWGVTSLEVYPGETRPIAEAGGPYFVDEGSIVSFDASGSIDTDDLSYRWDFDDDGIWDTGWVTSTLVSHSWDDDYSGNVRLEVFDGRLRDVDITTVTVNNVAPSFGVSGSTINENSIATISGSISDPGILDTFTIEIDWDEGAPQYYAYPAGTTTFSETHQYLDDNPTGTAGDVYSASVTVTDDDTGSSTEGVAVLVYNVAPVVTIDTMSQPNSQFILPEVHELNFGASYSDTGTLDTHTIEWNMGDGTIITGTLTPSHTYMDPGDYTITLNITDDDTGQGSATWDVEVVTIQEAIEDLDDYLQDRPDDNYKDKAKNRKKSFDNKFNAIYKMLENEEFQKIIDKLNLDIRIKCDGTIDGDPIDDWITDPTAQTHICQKIDDITAYLEYILTL